MEVLAENEVFCDFTYNGELYSIRSYVLEGGGDLAETVKADLMLFDPMEIVSEEYVDGKYGRILVLRFESADEDGAPVVGTGYYWYETGPTICCLEVSTDEWRDDGPEEMVKDSIYMVSSGSTEPYEVPPDLSESQTDEAMDSLMDEALREYYEPKPGPGDYILKP